MTFEAAISAGLPLVDLAKYIEEMIKKAKEAPTVVKRVLIFLDSVKMEVTALGKERQKILADTRTCNIGNKEQVEALYKRLDEYLHSDNIRPLLEQSLANLQKCIPDIEIESEKIFQLRRGDRQAAIREFLETFYELLNTLKGLETNFFPGKSGQGVSTLVPIYMKLKEIQDKEDLIYLDRKEKSQLRSEIDRLEESARHDPSHEQWRTNTVKVTGLITQLELAWKQ